MEIGNLLLVIDAQNDFCSPDGKMYVYGADKDMERLSEFVRRKESEIDSIVLSQDLHQVIDIAHPCFWFDKDGRNPAPFTAITPADVAKGTWTPYDNNTESALNYLNRLETQGEFPNVIWPEHCIEGSRGAAIVDELMERVMEWARNGRFFKVIPKGQNPWTEHFGIVRANIPDPADPSTLENKDLLDTLRCSSLIWLAGEAKSHCVANTVKQLLPYPEIVNKLRIMDDCMSSVKGFENIADSIYQNAMALGARMVTSTEI